MSEKKWIMLFHVLAKTTFWFTILYLQLFFLLQTCLMQGIECRFRDFAKMESWCGSTFHRLHRDFDQSQQTLEHGHHPTSQKSRAWWQDADIMHSTPRFLGGSSQISIMPYSNMYAKGLDSKSLCKLTWFTWNEVINSTNAIHYCKGMIIFCCKVFKIKRNNNFS
jgi:hypothetical protein